MAKDDKTTDEQNPPDPSGVTDPPTDPPADTPPPDAPPAEDSQGRYVGLLEQTLREQNATIQRLNEQLSQPTAPTAPPVDPAEQERRFYNEPVRTTREIIREELQTTVKPLLDFVQGMRSESEVDKLISRFRVDPRFVQFWDAAVESTVRQMLTALPANQVTDVNVQSAIVQALGLKAIGQLPGSAPQPPVQPQGVPVSQTTPAHLRPSAPPTPSAQPNGKRLRPLTENEKRLARERNMTDEEYLYWLELPAQEIGNAKFEPTVK